MKVLPVIHFRDRQLALEEASRARDCGADGVFLISHLGDDDLLVQVAAVAQAILPGFPVGINLLSRTAEEAVQAALAKRLPMVWADRMGVSSAGLTEEGRRLSALRQSTPGLELFASVAFKYQPYEPLPVRAAELARAAGFIPTTSGVGTGKAPDLGKIARMSEATHGTLAVASGMTPENIATYARHLSHSLVATGVSLDEHRMDESKLRRFISQARGRAS